MLKLLLLTLGTWSGVSFFLVGTLGFLFHLRQESVRACASRCAQFLRPAADPVSGPL